jgi:hypothetical protein
MSKFTTRLTVLALSGLVLGLLLIPATSQAATNFGSRLLNEPTETTCDTLGTCTIVSRIHPSDPNGDPYAGGAPVDGVITKFRYLAYASEEPGQVTFRVANLSLTDPNSLESALATAAGTGPTVPIQPSEDPETPIAELGGRLPVKAGQYLAVDITPSIGIVYNSDGSDRSYVFAPPLVDGAGQRGSTQVANELTVAATIEPDADGDGFGDETQDQCPSQATTQGACDNTPPGVRGLQVRNGKAFYNLSEAATVRFKLEKKSPGRKAGKKCVKQTPKNKNKKRCSRFKAVGAAFNGTGNVGPNQVTLPNGKKLKPGTYRLTMTVRDVAGNEATAKTTFTVAKKKPKKRK